MLPTGLLGGKDDQVRLQGLVRAGKQQAGVIVLDGGDKSGYQAIVPATMPPKRISLRRLDLDLSGLIGQKVGQTDDITVPVDFTPSSKDASPAVTGLGKGRHGKRGGLTSFK